MKFRTCVPLGISIGLWIFGITGCGPSGQDSGKSSLKDSAPGMIRVAGNAIFGSQCPYGTFPEPKPVPLTLWECPIGMSKVELVEPLQPLILQADCKKKTMDIRGTDRSHPAGAWEVMPDGSFFFSVEGGKARLKQDSAGKQNCTVPLTAELWGKVECDSRDQAKIKIESIWRAVKYAPEPQPSGTPGSSSSPGNTGPRPNGGDLTLRVREERPVAEPSSSPTAFPTSGPTSGPPPALAGETVAPDQCNFPKTCYFHTLTQVDQCY
jgi:hypothetical protein